VQYYRASVNVTDRELSYTSRLLEKYLAENNTWRKLAPKDEALLALVYMRKNETYPDVADGFGVGVGTAWRYTQEVIALLAAQAPSLKQALRHTTNDDILLLDGTLIHTDRVALPN